MSLFRAKILAALILNVFTATQMIPVAAWRPLEKSVQCAGGCGQACCCSTSGGMNCQQAAPAKSTPSWVSCKPSSPYPTITFPWLADWLIEWNRWLSTPAAGEMAFYELSLLPMASLAIPPPDGPPWIC